MSVLFPSPIYGPVRSRRLGVSLGVNLLPSDGKCCSFDCIYCECGYNRDHTPSLPLPSRGEVSQALEAQLVKMSAEGVTPDVITFAGNGEPTLHPEFAAVIGDTLALRDRLCPGAKVSVLTNATRIDRQDVFDALCRVDNNICKLDTVSPHYIRLADSPNGAYDVERIIARLKEFGQRCVIQAMFMRGHHNGTSVDNTGEEYVAPWLDAVRAIRPREVMIYTVDRDTPSPQLLKAEPATLDAIAERVRALGIDCKVAY